VSLVVSLKSSWHHFCITNLRYFAMSLPNKTASKLRRPETWTVVQGSKRSGLKKCFASWLKIVGLPLWRAHATFPAAVSFRTMLRDCDPEVVVPVKRVWRRVGGPAVPAGVCEVKEPVDCKTEEVKEREVKEETPVRSRAPEDPYADFGPESLSPVNGDITPARLINLYRSALASKQAARAAPSNPLLSQRKKPGIRVERSSHQAGNVGIPRAIAKPEDERAVGSNPLPPTSGPLPPAKDPPPPPPPFIGPERFNGKRDCDFGDPPHWLEAPGPCTGKYNDPTVCKYESLFRYYDVPIGQFHGFWKESLSGNPNFASWGRFFQGTSTKVWLPTAVVGAVSVFWAHTQHDAKMENFLLSVAKTKYLLRETHFATPEDEVLSAMYIPVLCYVLYWSEQQSLNVVVEEKRSSRYWAVAIPAAFTATSVALCVGHVMVPVFAMYSLLGAGYSLAGLVWAKNGANTTSRYSVPRIRF
jgi:hypothetical protein